MVGPPSRCCNFPDATSCPNHRTLAQLLDFTPCSGRLHHRHHHRPLHRSRNMSTCSSAFGKLGVRLPRRRFSHWACQAQRIAGRAAFLQAPPQRFRAEGATATTLLDSCLLECVARLPQPGGRSVLAQRSTNRTRVFLQQELEGESGQALASGGV